MNKIRVVNKSWYVLKDGIAISTVHKGDETKYVTEPYYPTPYATEKEAQEIADKIGGTIADELPVMSPDNPF